MELTKIIETVKVRTGIIPYNRLEDGRRITREECDKLEKTLYSLGFSWITTGTQKTMLYTDEKDDYGILIIKAPTKELENLYYGGVDSVKGRTQILSRVQKRQVIKTENKTAHLSTDSGSGVIDNIEKEVILIDPIWIIENKKVSFERQISPRAVVGFKKLIENFDRIL